mmetsp:Transcript_28055/g.97055  ORF Transcript_28055/g.97055 Transcript_28055/m.97055 type:complete len:203 (-) Transcript_28055:105-713(-)
MAALRGVAVVVLVVAAAVAEVTAAAPGAAAGDWRDVALRGRALDEDCCMGVCCNDNGDYRCFTTSTTCLSGTKYTGGAQCGAGNNGHICHPGGSDNDDAHATDDNVNHCSSGCMINGECQDTADPCITFIKKALGYIIGGVIIALCACAACVWFMCCRSSRREVTYVTLDAPAPGPGGAYQPPPGAGGAYGQAPPPQGGYKY